MPKFEVLSEEITNLIELERRTGLYTDVSFDEENVVRRKNIAKDSATVWRPTFVHDVDKIMHCPYYNRYSDKGFCPIYAKESIKRVYVSYHDLGGNDVATELYSKILKMPETPGEGGEL